MGLIRRLLGLQRPPGDQAIDIVEAYLQNPANTVYCYKAHVWSDQPLSELGAATPNCLFVYEHSNIYGRLFIDSYRFSLNDAQTRRINTLFQHLALHSAGARLTQSKTPTEEEQD